MKFKVREGFIVSRVEQTKLENGDVRERQINGYPGDEIELTAKQAEEHLHQLEPADKDAERFVKSKFVPSPLATQVSNQYNADVQAAITEGIKAGVAAALAAAEEARAAAPAAEATPPAA